MRSTRAAWLVSLVLSLLVVAYAARYLAFDPMTYFEQQRDVYLDRQVVLGLHVGGAIVALLLLPFQLARGLRRRHPRLHRGTGVLYVVGVAVGGLGGLALATTAHGGAVAGLGFAGLGAAWLGTTAAGVHAIGRRDLAAHQRWMIRSASLTFAAVTLRLYLGLAGAAGLPFDASYVAIAWLCWVPNLALALHLTRRGPVAPRHVRLWTEIPTT
ncbi:DUF2306 domain-containing protein [Aeromicrobium alkaliterrae]